MVRSILLLFFLAPTLFVSGQSDSIPIVKGPLVPQSGQVGVQDAQMIDLLMPVMPGVGQSGKTAISQQSLKPYMMPPRRVGAAGLTPAYSMAMLMEYYVNFDQNFKDNLSPDFISLNQGAKSMEEAFDFLASTGTVSAAIMPYDSKVIPTAVFATQKYRIKHYLHIFGDYHNERQKVFEVRKALSRGNPVLVEMLVSEGFSKIHGEKTWDPGKDPMEQSVVLLVVGFDQELEAFEVLGCWGKEWGMNGYLNIPYPVFGKSAENGYVLVPNP